MSSYPFDDGLLQQPVSSFPFVTHDHRSSSFGASLASPFSPTSFPQSPPASHHDHGAAGETFDQLALFDELIVSAVHDGSPFTISAFGADGDSTAELTIAPPASDVASFLSLSPHSRSSAEPDTAAYVHRSSASATSAVSTNSSERVTATEAPVKKRRRNVADLSSEQLMRRRAQHRQVDASRRQKEAASIARLLRLIRQQHQPAVAGVAGEADADETGTVEADEDDDDMDGSQQKAGRQTVLESSIALIEQLTAACQRMEAACNAKDAQVSRMSSQLHSVAALLAQQATDSMAVASSVNRAAAAGDCNAQLSSFRHPRLSSSSPTMLPNRASSSFLSVLPSSTSSYLAQSDRSHTLSRGGFSTFSTLCIAVVTSNGIVLDVSDRLLTYTGWGGSDLVHTTFEDYDTDEQRRAGILPITPLVLANQQPNPCDRTQLRYVQQYPASIEQIIAVKKGEKRKAHATWRYRISDGSVVETDSTFWGEWDVPVVKGHPHRPPDRMLLVYEMQDAVVVDCLEGNQRLCVH